MKTVHLKLKNLLIYKAGESEFAKVSRFFYELKSVSFSHEKRLVNLLLR